MMTLSSPWLACRLRRPEAPVRLFCFPHSGGSVGEYVRWADTLRDVEVWGVQLPGRGSRAEEPPFTRLHALVDTLVDAVDFGTSFAFFGHSLGALVAFETARRLRGLGRALPRWLFLSAAPAPQQPARGIPASHLDEDGLLTALEPTYGELAVELREDPELRELILPGLRADLLLVESYRHEAREPLDCAMSVIGGTQDDLTREDLEPWRAHTTGPFELRLLSGGHFYLREQKDTLLHLLGERLRQGHPPPSPART
ncbi:thioesterase II family protein [Pyxidicoccus xibeiensis]|uniref:thioesterase II family protein n=1 Tax=Pyxidicoccus xibeiensis TaxID=2906759 RepID=UPI0020A83666|nr:alpha/beta fold hydrolase [Pyxidicoccus xibeiensis]MCP3138285.1 alpha/beta fold hydrolase [Pyxidicoccus xibeiensis]